MTHGQQIPLERIRPAASWASRLAIVALTTSLLGGTALLANAELIDRGADNYGNHLIYDSELNVTWYQPNNNGQNWFTAHDYAANLAITYQGKVFNDWRLPKATDIRTGLLSPGCYVGWGDNQPGNANCLGELAHLYLALGGKSDPTGSAGNWSGTNPRAYGNNNPFHTWPACTVSSCLGGGYYWLDEGAPYELSVCQMTAGEFFRWNTDYWGPTGATGPVCATQTDYKFAWAVRDGDVLAAPSYVALTVTKSGSGTVTSSPAGINCGTDCSESYASGTSVNLTATAAAGSTFAGWGGDCAGYVTQPTCTLSMNAAKHASATFSSTGGGTLVPLTGAMGIAAGDEHTCAVIGGGGAKCWGWNYYFQLSDNTNWLSRPIAVGVSGLPAPIEAITAGGSHTCARTSDNRAMCWGDNRQGQLGNGDFSLSNPTPEEVHGLTNPVIAVGAGYMHTCAVHNGGASCWGDNRYGQGGNISLNQSNSPIPVTNLTVGVTAVAPGYYHTCAIRNGGAKCWGNNDSGQLGNPASDYIHVSYAPVDVSGLTADVRAVATGRSHSCALTTGGAVWCWGANSYGQLGNDSTIATFRAPVDVVGLSAGVTEIATGYLHSCALQDGAVKCWGENTYGQLGDGSTTHTHKPVSVKGLPGRVLHIAAGYYHTCAVLQDSGAVKCWGRNSYGQLGNNDTSISELLPVDVLTESNVSPPITPPSGCTLNSDQLSVFAGGRVKLTANCGGGMVASYTWMGGQFEEGRSTPENSVSVPVDKTTSFKVVAKNVAGWSNEATTKVLVLATPAPLSCLWVQPSKLIFADKFIGENSASVAVTVTNRCSTAVQYRETSVINSSTGTFSFIDGCEYLWKLYAQKLQPGAQCTVNVTFTPHTAGWSYANLVLDGEKGTENVPLEGRAWNDPDARPLPEKPVLTTGVLLKPTNRNFGRDKPTVVLTHGLETYSAMAQEPSASDLWTGFGPRQAGELLDTSLGDTANIRQYVWNAGLQGTVWGEATEDAYLAALEHVRASGEDLASKLEGLLGPLDTLTQPIHFIGHGLGAAVNAYAARRVLTQLSPGRQTSHVPQFTILDFPHFVDRIGLSENEALQYGFDRTFFAAVLGDMQTWAKLQIENYYVAESSSGLGTPIAGDAYNHPGLYHPHQLETLFPGEKGANDNDGVQQWYRWTINPDRTDFRNNVPPWYIGFNSPWDWPNSRFCQYDDTFTSPKMLGVAMLDGSLNPCGKGWSWASGGSRPFPPTNGLKPLTHSTAVQMGNFIARGCPIDIVQIDIWQIRCPSILGWPTQKASASTRTPFVTSAGAQESVVGAFAQITIPADAKYLSMRTKFTAPSAGDSAIITIDDQPIWSVLASTFPDGIGLESGPIPIAGLAGPRTLALALHRVAGSTTGVYITDAKFISATTATNSHEWVQEAYVAYYGRPADPGGFTYWSNRIDAEGGSLSSIIAAFGTSVEFNRRYGGLTNTQLVTKIYQQALGRDPDPGGLNWYINELLAGRRTLQTITLDVLNGATTAPDSTIVANKLDVATYYTAKVAAGCPYGTEQDGVNALLGVTAVSATVTSAKAAIDSRCGP